MLALSCQIDKNNKSNLALNINIKGMARWEPGRK